MVRISARGARTYVLKPAEKLELLLVCIMVTSTFLKYYFLVSLAGWVLLSTRLTLFRNSFRLLKAGVKRCSKRIYAVNISVQYAEVLVAKIVLLISYFITIPIVGWVRAWVAQKMGDDTPEQLGFLTINPMAHISLLWVCFIMFLTDFGFGKYIPINPLNIHGRWRPARLVAAYLSDAFASIVLAFLALFGFVS